MGNTRWCASAVLLVMVTLLAGCRSQPDRPAESYVLQEVAFLDEKAASPEIEAECRLLQLLETSLIENGAKLGITVVKPPAEGGGSSAQNKLTVSITQVVGGRFGNITGPRWVVSEVYATLSVEDAKGTREREVFCSAGLGMNPLGNLTFCDRINRCANDLGVKMMRWLQRTR